MLLLNEPIDTYHASGALTAHRLADFATSPLLYYRRHILHDPGWQRMDSAALGLGRLAHLVTLEPAMVAGIAVKPEGLDGRTKEGKEWAAKNSGRVICSREDYDAAVEMAESVREALAVALGADKSPLSPAGAVDGCHAECVVRDEEGQCRPDLLDKRNRICYDLKTTSNLDKFRWSIKEFRYDLAAAWYLRRLDREMPGMDGWKWRWLVVETAVPYRARIVKCDSVILDAGMKISPLLKRLDDCRRSGVWPRSATGYEYNLDTEGEQHAP